MALNAYLTLKGQKQGDIKGSTTQKGREGKIEVIAVSHSVISPRDAASGLPSGKRMHKPYVVTHEIDQALPLEYNALCQNENISTWQLDFWTTATQDRTLSVGAEWNNFSVKLTNASICSIDFRMANNKHPELMKFKEYAEVAFVYQKIEWIWVKGGITSIDDWEAPVT
jgi:type VI secretion system secreted protein Hcp